MAWNNFTLILNTWHSTVPKTLNTPASYLAHLAALASTGKTLIVLMLPATPSLVSNQSPSLPLMYPLKKRTKPLKRVREGMKNKGTLTLIKPRPRLYSRSITNITTFTQPGLLPITIWQVNWLAVSSMTTGKSKQALVSIPIRPKANGKALDLWISCLLTWVELELLFM